MTEEPLTEALVRRFLLGEVDDAQREVMERRFMSDAQAKIVFLLAEEELIEDYLEDNLPTPEREEFLKQYASTAYQRQKLGIQRSIKEWAATEDRVGARNSDNQPSRLWFSQTLKSPWLAAAAAAALVVLVAAGYFWRLSSKRSTESARHLAIEQELAKLNRRDTVENSGNGAKISYATLAPVSVRSAEAQKQVTIPSDSQIVELQLIWTESRVYPSYRAAVRRVGSNEQFTISSLLPEKREAGSGIRLKLPATLLTPALYQITLQGVSPEGVLSQSEEYSFMASH